MGGRRAAAAVSAIALAIALPAAVACEQALSIDGPVTVAPHDACGLPMSPGSCQACVASKCCSQASACAADQACASYESCTLACGSDYVCRTRCAIAQTQSQAGISPLDTCVASECSDACQEACGLPAAPTEPDAAAACASCMGTRTCTETQACTRDLTCEALTHCIAGCTTLDCHQTCLDSYDGGIFTSLEVALITSCQKPCELGQLWICLGANPFPTLPPGQDDVTVTLADSTSAKALPDIQVNACGPSDAACSPPVATGTTDPAGSATLTFPAHSTLGLGFKGYFEFKPQSDASVEVPQLLFPAQNFSVSHTHLGWIGFSQASLAADAAVPGVTIDPTKGQLFLQAFDCLQAQASDVTFQVTQGGQPSPPIFYWVGGSFSASITATGIVGLAAVFNVPPGVVDVVATPTRVGHASSKVSAFIRPGWVTSVALAPNQ